MYLIPENLGPKVGGQFCNCIIKPEAICFGHSGKKKKKGPELSVDYFLVVRFIW